jgi:nucleotide-binding universal stress UspA family protein
MVEVNMYKKIMVPLDGSELAECVLPHVEAIANGIPVKELVILRVVEPERFYAVADSPIDPNLASAREAEGKKRAEDYLAEVVNRLDLPGLTIKTKAIVGRVAESLVDYCVDERVDLIIIATHGRSGVTRWVRGSVADKILRSSKIPVLMIRAPGTEQGI